MTFGLRVKANRAPCENGSAACSEESKRTAGTARCVGRRHRERMERVRFSECDLKRSSNSKTLSAQLTDANHGTKHPSESKRSCLPVAIATVALASFFAFCGRSMANDRPRLTPPLNCPFDYGAHSVCRVCAGRSTCASCVAYFRFAFRLLIGGISK